MAEPLPHTDQGQCMGMQCLLRKGRGFRVHNRERLQAAKVRIPMGRMLPALAAAMISLVIAMTVSARASDGNYLAHGAASADARRRSAAPPRNDTSACCASSHNISRVHVKRVRCGVSAEGFSAADSGSKL